MSDTEYNIAEESYIPNQEEEEEKVANTMEELLNHV